MIFFLFLKRNFLFLPYFCLCPRCCGYMKTRRKYYEEIDDLYVDDRFDNVMRHACQDTGAG